MGQLIAVFFLFVFEIFDFNNIPGIIELNIDNSRIKEDGNEFHNKNII